MTEHGRKFFKKLKQLLLSRLGRRRIGLLLFGAFLAILLSFILSAGWTGTRIVKAQSPIPTPDRMAEPELPENPTQYQDGRHLYWLHCMPCHGDIGQGLTDEFRALWVDDHQDCWGRGCHGGRAMEEGFPIPRIVPAIISSTGNLPNPRSAEELYQYLDTTHPPQDPGYLTEDEYWSMTAYVLTENNHLLAGQEVGPQAEKVKLGAIILITFSIVLAILIVSFVITWIQNRRKPPTTHSQSLPTDPTAAE